MYAQGRGVPRDDTEAVRWLRLAVDQGDSIAEYNLQGMFREGRAIPEDEEEAASWTRLAAEDGNAIAQTNFALM